MKIYFTASIGGMYEFENNYREIVNDLESLGHEIIARHIFNVTSQKLAKESIKEREEHYKQLRKWLVSCDIVVIEASHPSTNVGFEISMALERDKPVLVLHIKGRVPVLLLGLNTNKLRIVEYSLPELSHILETNIDGLSHLSDTRFNFFISKSIVSYLDWIARKRRLPRAVYLRQLINKEMRKYPEFRS